MIAMGVGGFFGLICLYGLVILLKRRLTNPRIRASSNPMDIALLWLLLAQLLLGFKLDFCLRWSYGRQRDVKTDGMGPKYCDL